MSGHHPLLRRRDGGHAHVTNEELFFDLVYAFAVTQLSHTLLHHLTPGGALEALILWFATWLGWQYMCWLTNWFDPEKPAVRALVFALTLLALVMSSAIPQAFGDRGMVFALAYVAMQVGRSLFAVVALGPGQPLYDNYRRILGWTSISAVFWIGGALVQHEWRAALWLVAVLCEYVSPMFGFALPVLGRSSTAQDWTIEGAHLAERCQLFVIVAIGEAMLITGATLSEAPVWSPALVSATLAAFLGTLALWWLYFGTSSKDATATITHASDPGKVGAYFHYVHAILIAGIVVSAVGNDLVLGHPYGALTTAQVMAVLGGPAIYLLGSVIYKRVVYGTIAVSHIAGAAALVLLVPVAYATDLLVMGWLTTLVLLVVCLWNWRVLQRRRQAVPPPR